MNKKAKKVIAAAVSFSAALNLTACVYGPPPEDYEETTAEAQSLIVCDDENTPDENEEVLF